MVRQSFEPTHGSGRNAACDNEIEESLPGDCGELARPDAEKSTPADDDGSHAPAWLQTSMAKTAHVIHGARIRGKPSDEVTATALNGRQARWMIWRRFVQLDIAIPQPQNRGNAPYAPHFPTIRNTNTMQSFGTASTSRPPGTIGHLRSADKAVDRKLQPSHFTSSLQAVGPKWGPHSLASSFPSVRSRCCSCSVSFS